MKKTILISISICIVSILNAQHTVFHTTTFEDDWSFIEFEPAEGNIWQVGTPSKDFLDSAYTRPYALMTDTLNSLYEAGEHSFILKLERPYWGNCLSGWQVQFFQKYSFDSTNSGGFVEVSYDQGETWNNFVFDDFTGTYCTSVNMYTEYDTLVNGEPACTNQYSWIAYPTGIMHGLAYPDIIDIYHVWLKFTYINLSTDNPHEGWMIDNIDFNAIVWDEYINVTEKELDNNLSIYPNPVSSTIYIDIKENFHPNIVFILFSICGNQVLSTLLYENSVNEINIEHLTKGIYLYSIYDDSFSKSGKIIKE